MKENVFGSILKELRKANKVNQTELAVWYVAPHRSQS
jgi:hypothetical protein